MWFRKAKPDPADVMGEMREQVFSTQAQTIDIAPASDHARIWVVVMETGYPEAVASLVVVADGTTSLYFSNGGGIIGAGEHGSVRTAAARFLALANSHADALVPTADHPLPAVARVRFYARTFDGLLTADANEQALGYNRHPLSALFHAGHAVIAAMNATNPAS